MEAEHAVESYDIRRVVNDNFVTRLRTAAANGALAQSYTPMDGVPWEINMILEISAYKAARAAFLTNRS